MFRGSDGELGVIDAYCPHMGAHLAGAKVVGNGLRCALHHFTLDRSGHCHDRKGMCQGKARPWPVAEYHGLVLVFCGDGEPSVSPTTCLPDGYTWITAPPVFLETDWRAMMVNAFDLSHMQVVHRRMIVGEPDLFRTEAGALRLCYESRVTPGGGLSDRLMRWLSDDRIRVRQTCFGTTIVVESHVGRHRTAAVMGLVQEGGRVLARGAFGVPRGVSMRWLRLRLARWLFTAFLRRDFRVVRNMRLTLDDVTDTGVRAVADYLDSLPEIRCG